MAGPAGLVPAPMLVAVLPLAIAQTLVSTFSLGICLSFLLPESAIVTDGGPR